MSIIDVGGLQTKRAVEQLELEKKARFFDATLAAYNKRLYAMDAVEILNQYKLGFADPKGPL